MQAVDRRKSMGMNNLASLLTKVKGKMVPTRLAAHAEKNGQAQTQSQSRSRAIMGRSVGYDVNSGNTKARARATSLPFFKSDANNGPERWNQSMRNTVPMQHSHILSPYSLKASKLNSKINQVRPSVLAKRTLKTNDNSKDYDKTNSAAARQDTLKNTRTRLTPVNYNKEPSQPRKANISEPASKGPLNQNKPLVKPFEPRPVSRSQKIDNRVGSKTSKFTKRELSKENSAKEENQRVYLKKSNRHAHDLSLNYHQNVNSMSDPGMTITRALRTPKFARKLIDENSSEPSENNKNRKLFLEFADDARDRKDEQQMRFSEIFRKTLSRAINKYNFTEHLGSWNRDSVGEIHKLYTAGIREIRDSRDFLLDKMDSIYNNFITPARWNA